LAIFFCLLSLFNKSLIAQNEPFAHFDASPNSYIYYGLGSTLNGYNYTNKFSIALWARWNDKNNSNTGNWANIFTLTDTVDGDNGVFWIQHNEANTAFEFAIQTNTRTFIQSTTNPQNNIWYHIAAVYNGSTMKLYINGNEEVSVAKTGNVRQVFNSSQLFMGQWASSANNYRRFYGSIDEVMIFNKALTQAEIVAAMTTPELLTGLNYDTTNLMGYYNFDNYAATDLTPNQNNGVIGQAVALPVTLESFSVEKTPSNIVEIFWVTLSEINNDYFTVEKSSNLQNYHVVEEVLAAGNSNTKQFYKATDKTPYQGLSFYRLLQTDFDGKTEIVGIEEFVNNSHEEFDVMIYPNPVIPNSKIIIKTSFEFQDDINLLISSFDGTDVYTDITQINYNNKSVIILEPQQPLSKGLYLITFEVENKLVSKKLLVN